MFGRSSSLEWYIFHLLWSDMLDIPTVNHLPIVCRHYGLQFCTASYLGSSWRSMAARRTRSNRFLWYVIKEFCWVPVYHHFTGLFGIYYSLQYLSLSDAVTITFLIPTTTAIAGYLILGEVLSRKEMWAGCWSTYFSPSITIDDVPPNSPLLCRGRTYCKTCILIS